MRLPDEPPPDVDKTPAAQQHKEHDKEALRAAFLVLSISYSYHVTVPGLNDTDVYCRTSFAAERLVSDTLGC